MLLKFRHANATAGRRRFIASLLLFLVGRPGHAAQRRIVERDGWFLDSADR
jgi:hypothetical protein